MNASRARNLWRASALLLVPLLALEVTWLYRTVDMYRDLGLRILGDSRLTGMTLHQAGVLQYHYLSGTIEQGLSRAFSNETNVALPRVHLFVQERDIAQLDAALPQSGMSYVDGRFFYDGEFNEVKVRYRGDFAYHWGYFKRSYRIKTKRNNLFSGIRRLNLIVPKTGFLYSNHAGYELARTIGLVAPRSKLVLLNLNGRDQGLILMVEQLSESTLRANGLLPGDIYSGENYYGIDVWQGLETQHVFELPGIWTKTAINNHYPPEHNAPLKTLIARLHQDHPADLAKLLDFDAFARLALWEYITQSEHLDDTHNWRLFYDPGRGKFIPLLWDGTPWAKQFIPGDWPDTLPKDPVLASQLMQVLHESPDFVVVRQQVFHDFFTSTKPDDFLDDISTWNNILGEQAANEPILLAEGPVIISTDEAVNRMKEVEELVAHVVEAGRERYGRQPDAVPDKRQEPLIWRDTIVIEADRQIDSPVIIEAGTRILLAQDVSVFFQNRVLIEGSTRQPVVFERKKSKEAWGAIVIEGQQAAGSALRHFKVSGGSGYRDDLRLYSGMLSIHDVPDITLEACHLENNSHYDDMLHVVYSHIEIDDCKFLGAPMDAVDLDMATASIRNSTFSKSGNDGLDLMGTRMTAESLTFIENGDKGISIGERSTLQIANSRFEGNLIGMQVKDDSMVIADNLVLSGNGIALDAYAKNWRYGTGGRASVCGSTFSGNTEQVRVDKHSDIVVLDRCDSRSTKPLELAGVAHD